MIGCLWAVADFLVLYTLTVVCSFTGDAYLIYRRILHIDGLMRTRVTRDGSKLIISTTDGYMIVIHDLNLDRITKDLFGFVPSNHLIPLRGIATLDPPGEDPFEYLFTAKRNRVEIITDFPMDDEPSMIPSLEVNDSVFLLVSYV